MRRIWLALLTLLVLSWTGPGVRADDPPAKKSTWWPTWLGFGKKTAPKNDDKTPQAKVDTGKAIKIEPTVLRDKEKADLLRRVEVCNNLREIAYQTKDEDLARKAEQLEQRAFDLYKFRIAQLPMKSIGQEGDLQILERHLGLEANGRQRGSSSATAGQAMSPGRATRREE